MVIYILYYNIHTRVIYVIQIVKSKMDLTSKMIILTLSRIDCDRCVLYENF